MVQSTHKELIIDEELTCKWDQKVIWQDPTSSSHQYYQSDYISQSNFWWKIYCETEKNVQEQFKKG